MSQYHKDRREALKAEGLCINCHQPTDGTYCRECLGDRTAQYVPVRFRRKLRDTLQMFVDDFEKSGFEGGGVMAAYQQAKKVLAEVAR